VVRAPRVALVVRVEAARRVRNTVGGLIGLLLGRSRGIVDHFGATGRPAQRLLPLGSAVIVTVLGAGISVKGVLARAFSSDESMR
jgi:hypothetical protein